MVQCSPAFRQIGGSPGNHEWTRGHQSVQFHKVMPGFMESFVNSSPDLALAWEFAEGPRIFWIGHLAQFKAEIPDIPIIHTAARIFFPPIALVEDNPWIRPDGRRKFVTKTRS